MLLKFGFNINGYKLSKNVVFSLLYFFYSRFDYFFIF